MYSSCPAASILYAHFSCQTATCLYIHVLQLPSSSNIKCTLQLIILTIETNPNYITRLCRCPLTRARARSLSWWWLLALTSRITNETAAVAFYFNIQVAFERPRPQVTMPTSQDTKPSCKHASLPFIRHAHALSQHRIFW